MTLFTVYIYFSAERQNHAREIMRTFDVTTINGIVISSGDGLLYEVCSLLWCTCTFCVNVSGSCVHVRVFLLNI